MNALTIKNDGLVFARNGLQVFCGEMLAVDSQMLCACDVALIEVFPLAYIDKRVAFIE
jgi:hypothetical protein